MRVALLYNSVEHNSVEGAGPDHLDVLTQLATVRSAVEGAGMECVEVACDLDLARLRARLVELAPEIAFNLVESLAADDRFVAFVPALLDSLAVPYTGVGYAAAVASGSKLETKRLLAAAGLPVLPCAGVWPESLRARVAVDDDCGGPFVIKSVWNHGSPGLGDVDDLAGADDHGLVGDRRQLRARLRDLAPVLGGSCLAEPYLPGRELNVSLLGGVDAVAGVEVLPIAEILFADYPEDKPKIVGYRAKWCEDSFEYQHTPRSFDFPASDQRLLERVADLSLSTWSALGMTGYARVDFRIAEDGSPFILEGNANPCLSPDAGFAAAVERAGRSLDQVLIAILDDAWRRLSPVDRPFAIAETATPTIR